MSERLRTIANLATAASAVAAVVIVYLAVRDVNERAEEERILKWQGPLIYGVIRENPGISFSELRVQYLSAASQLDIPLPVTARQDPEINRAILSLLKAQVVHALPGGGFEPNLITPFESNMVEGFLELLEEQKFRRRARSPTDAR